jgi:hypothetical protein
LSLVATRQSRASSIAQTNRTPGQLEAIHADLAVDCTGRLSHAREELEKPNSRSAHSIPVPTSRRRTAFQRIMVFLSSFPTRPQARRLCREG